MTTTTTHAEPETVQALFVERQAETAIGELFGHVGRFGKQKDENGDGAEMLRSIAADYFRDVFRLISTGETSAVKLSAAVKLKRDAKTGGNPLWGKGLVVASNTAIGMQKTAGELLNLPGAMPDGFNVLALPGMVKDATDEFVRELLMETTAAADSDAELAESMRPYVLEVLAEEAKAARKRKAEAAQTVEKLLMEMNKLMDAVDAVHVSQLSISDAVDVRRLADRLAAHSSGALLTLAENAAE